MTTMIHKFIIKIKFEEKKIVSHEHISHALPLAHQLKKNFPAEYK